MATSDSQTSGSHGQTLKINSLLRYAGLENTSHQKSSKGMVMINRVTGGASVA